MIEGGVRIVLFVLDLFVGITAIGGGVALVTGAERTRFSTEILEGTPFRSFVVPGLILAVIVGGSAAAAALFVVLDRAAGGAASMLAGAMLTGFIATEVRILKDEPGWHWTEVLYFATGLLMIALGGVALLQA